MESIPQEIVEEILQNLDHFSLLACATVSRQFLPGCRAYIFHRIVISPSKGAVDQHAALTRARCSRLRQIFTETPCLPGYVRILRLRLDTTLANDPNMPWIVGQLKRLTHLRLVSSPALQVQWDSLGLQLRCAIVQCIHRPTMTSLSFSNHYEIPLSILDGATSLAKLTSHASTWSATDLSLPPRNPARPVTLQITGTYYTNRFARVGSGQHLDLFLTPPLCPFSFDALTDLYTDLRQANQASLSKLLERCRSGLSRLTLRIYRGTSLDLSPLSALQYLILNVDLDELVSNNGDINFPAMIDTLASVKSATLRRINIDFSLDVNDLHQFGWKELDEVLYGIAKDKPSFHVELSQLIRESDDRFDAVRNEFPRFVGLGTTTLVTLQHR